MDDEPAARCGSLRRRVTKEQLAFERLVSRAVGELPADVLDALDNVAVVVEDEPTARQLETSGLGPGDELYGLYEGVPLTQRGSYYSMVLPDKITVFRGPIERACRSYGEMKQLVKDVVRHEVAHYFGFSDEALSEM